MPMSHTILVKVCDIGPCHILYLDLGSKTHIYEIIYNTNKTFLQKCVIESISSKVCDMVVCHIV